MGLAVVKEIVDRHQGYVTVEGEKNVGACFTIHLPMIEDRKKRHGEKKDARKRIER